MKKYCVVYLSPGGVHYRFRCSAANKREARRIAREGVGCSNNDIVEVYEEG